MPPTTTQPTVKVWDRFVRVFHWTLVLSFVIAWQSTEQIGWLHKGFGYLALALVLARLVWGFVGSSTARFANFVPGPGKLLRYLAAVARMREPRHLGHNPAGAVMIVFLLVAMAVIGLTGWMMTLDAFWGNDTVETLHVVTVDAMLVAVCIHVAANVYASLRHRENLIASMVTGHKRADPGAAATRH
jgi:cytochrome b